MIFFKAIIIGIAKIIPGVSGAMLAINFNIYERLLDSITNFFDNPKNNTLFLFKFSLGIMISLFLFSNIIIFFISNYLFLTMMFFIGLILYGTYSFSLDIKYNYKNILLIIIISLLLIMLGICELSNKYVINGSFMDNIIFFIGGIIEIGASIIPGISATSLLMILGIYEDILILISNIFNYSYIIDHFNLYFSYGLGMFISFIISVSLINHCIKKYKNTSYCVILGLSIGSVILLLFNIFNISISLLEFILGVILLTLGLFIAFILDR